MALCSVLCDPDTVRLRDAVVDIYAVNVGLRAIALCTGMACATPAGASSLKGYICISVACMRTSVHAAVFARLAKIALCHMQVL